MSVTGIPSPLPPYTPAPAAAPSRQTGHEQQSSDAPPRRQREKTPASAQKSDFESAPRSDSIGVIVDVRV